MNTITTSYEIPLYLKHTRDEKYVHELSHVFTTYFQEPVPETLWHYTSNEAFEKIIQSNQLWFTHISGLNDLTEGEHAVRLAKVIISSYLQGNISPRQSILLKTMRDRMLVSNKDSSWFTFSLSDALDDRLQWEAYGDRNRGIAIGFQSKELVRFISKSPVDRPMLCKVIYEEQKAIDFGSLILSIAMSNFTNDFAHVEDDKIAVEEFITSWESIRMLFQLH
jgi:hypothetical protein